jgi:quercetin dioxygenase-like cupin family protein
MKEFPAFMKQPANRIATASQATSNVEGYVFDGAEGSQMAFWTCFQNAPAAPHVHEFDEYMVVIEGRYTLLIDGKRIPVNAGEEYVIPRGVLHGGEVVAGTRVICAFRQAEITKTEVLLCGCAFGEKAGAMPSLK